MMGSRRGVLFLVGVSLALVLMPAVAFASAPKTVPQTILTEGFETSTPKYTVVKDGPSTAQWGAVARARSGTRGLWGAGSAGLLTKYPSGTNSRAVFALPQAQYFYSTQLNFYYQMPSIGLGDDTGFQVAWQRTGQDGIDPLLFPSITSAWKPYTANLTTGPQSLSRRAGSVWFRFDDVSARTPDTGAGPTLDDVKITGWKYGPVRWVSAKRADGKVDLSWQRPRRSTHESTLEERTIGYRVWRAPYGTTSYTELTSGSIAGTGLVSWAPKSGRRYTYVIQAVDSGGGYGEIARSHVDFPENGLIVPKLAQSFSATTVKYGGSSTAVGTLADSDTGKPLTNMNVQLQYCSGGWKVMATKATDAYGKASFSAKPVGNKKTRFRMRFSASGFESATTAEKIVTPRPYLGVPSKPKTVYKRKTFTARVSLKPRHKAGKTDVVQIRCYRLEKGKWVLRKRVWGKTYDYSSYSRVAAKIALPYTGTWKMRAYAPADSQHAKHYGAYTAKFKVTK